MGLFERFKINKPKTINIILEHSNEKNNNANIMTEEQTKNSTDEIPLWKSTPSEENRAKDKLHTIDYKNVKVYFKNGTIIDVIPDVNNYYLANIYNIDGKDYDITNISSIESIPIPEEKYGGYSDGTPVYKLEYLLRLHAGLEKEKGNSELAYTLMHKGTKLLRYSNIEWQRHDYLREYFWLLDDDRIDEAENFFQNISPILPTPYSEKEHTKEIQHYKYALLKHHFKDEMPKSFSAYMRNFNKKDEKFKKYIELAKQININLES